MRRHRIRRFEPLESRLQLSAIAVSEAIPISQPHVRPRGSITIPLLADLDADGDLDYGLNWQDPSERWSMEGTFQWFENTDGLGSFLRNENQVHDSIATTTDVDGDGWVDLVSVKGNELRWYRNQQDNSFASVRSFLKVADQIVGYSFEDVDGDQDADLVTVEGDRSVHVTKFYENDRGTLGTGRVVHSRQADSDTAHVKLIDLDGDLDFDLVDQADTGEISWFENQGMAEFVHHTIEHSARQTGSFTGYASDNEIVDLDLDGDLDIAPQVNRPGDPWVWFENRKTESGIEFVERILPGGGAMRLTYRDFDADGDIDIYGACVCFHLIELYLRNESNGEFAVDQVESQFFDHGPNPSWLGPTGDLNADGRPDVAWVDDNNALWYENSSGSYFDLQPHFVVESDLTRPVSIAAIDLDGDEDLDIVVVDMHEAVGEAKFGAIIPMHSVTWFENTDGEGTFVKGGRTPRRADSLTFADLDNDGLLDIVAIPPSFLRLETIWQKNLGSGKFADPETFNRQGWSKLEVHDFDDDGLQDILLGFSSSILLVGTPDGYIEKPLGFGSYRIAVTDITGDGLLDIVNLPFVPSLGATMDIYRNLGQHQFELHQSVEFPPNLNFYDLQAADLENDGDIDIVAVTWLKGIYVFENQDGMLERTFSDANRQSEISNRFALADLSGDGKQDLIYERRRGIGYFEFVGDDGIGYEQRQEFPELGEFKDAVAGDFDGDGDNDLVALFNTDRLVWFRIDPTGVDLTQDGRITGDDIDALYAAVGDGRSDAEFDLNADDQADVADVTYLVRDILRTDFGDLDVDGKVDFSDFLTLSSNFGKQGTWQDGELSGDGLVDFTDFLMLAASFGFHRDS